MRQSENRFVRKFGLFLILTLSFFGILAVFAGTNIAKIDSMLGSILSWIGVGKAYDRLAIYDDFILTASADEFFTFASGYGRSLLADMRIKFPDGSVYRLEDVPLEIAEKYASEKSEIPAPSGNGVITRYDRGFNSFNFIESRLWGITLRDNSSLQIDFGDGQFVELPVDRITLLKVLGPPEQWGRVERGMP